MHFPTYILALASTVLCAVLDTLPPTPELPAPISNIRTPINGVQLWSQKYNEAAGGPPIVLIPGGLGSCAYFGAVISILQKSHYVICVDRRGHGRSTYAPNDVFTYEQFARDTKALLAKLGVTKSLWVGWSDGAATTLAGLLDPGIKPGIEKAFVFAGFQSFRDTNATFPSTAIYKEFVSRCRREYAVLQPGANFTDFAKRVATLEGTTPNWSDADLTRIEARKVTIAGADHDEAINLGVPEHLHAVIKGSRLDILTGVSHFAPMQKPVQFARAVEESVAA